MKLSNTLRQALKGVSVRDMNIITSALETTSLSEDKAESAVMALLYNGSFVDKRNNCKDIVKNALGPYFDTLETDAKYAGDPEFLVDYVTATAFQCFVGASSIMKLMCEYAMMRRELEPYLGDIELYPDHLHEAVGFLRRQTVIRFHERLFNEPFMKTNVADDLWHDPAGNGDCYGAYFANDLEEAIRYLRQLGCPCDFCGRKLFNGDTAVLFVGEADRSPELAILLDTANKTYRPLTKVQGLASWKWAKEWVGENGYRRK